MTYKISLTRSCGSVVCEREASHWDMIKLWFDSIYQDADLRRWLNVYPIVPTDIAQPSRKKPTKIRISSEFGKLTVKTWLS